MWLPPFYMLNLPCLGTCMGAAGMLRDKCEGWSCCLETSDSAISSLLKKPLCTFFFIYSVVSGMVSFYLVLSVASHERFSIWNRRGVKYRLRFSLITLSLKRAPSYLWSVLRREECSCLLWSSHCYPPQPWSRFKEQTLKENPGSSGHFILRSGIGWVKTTKIPGWVYTILVFSNMPFISDLGRIASEELRVKSMMGVGSR